MKIIKNYGTTIYKDESGRRKRYIQPHNDKEKYIDTKRHIEREEFNIKYFISFVKKVSRKPTEKFKIESCALRYQLYTYFIKHAKIDKLKGFEHIDDKKKEDILLKLGIDKKTLLKVHKNINAYKVKKDNERFLINKNNIPFKISNLDNHNDDSYYKDEIKKYIDNRKKFTKNSLSIQGNKEKEKIFIDILTNKTEFPKNFSEYPLTSLCKDLVRLSKELKENKKNTDSHKMKNLYRRHKPEKSFSYKQETFKKNKQDTGFYKMKDYYRKHKPEKSFFHKQPERSLYEECLKDVLDTFFPKKIRSPQPKIDYFYKKNSDELEKYIHDLISKKIYNKAISYTLKKGKEDYYKNKDTSQDQFEIKQKESLARCFYTVISFAQRKLTDIYDPEGTNLYNDKEKRDDDILLRANNNEVGFIKEINEDDNNEKIFEILFGENYKLFAEKRGEFSHYLSRNLYLLRNRTFHFKKFSDLGLLFNKKGNNKISPDEYLSNAIKKYIEKDEEQYRDRVAKKLDELNIGQYLEIENIEKISKEIFIGLGDKDSFLKLALPKFSKIIKRYENIKGKGKDKIPSISNSSSTESEKIKYHIAKLCYDSGFRKWLYNIEKKPDSIKKWIKTSKDRIKQQAGTKSHISDYPDYTNNLEEYFNKLIGLQASILHSTAKNYYKNNSKGTKEILNSVEKFKQEIIGIAFNEFLNENIPFVLKLKKETRISEEISLEKIINIFSKKEDTQKIAISEELYAFYMILHLVPAGQVNYLYHQIQKTYVLKTDDNDIIKDFLEKLQKCLYLYLKMHDAKISIDSIENRVEIFFENPSALKKLLKDKSSQELVPIRGLRECQRFGSLKLLENLCEKYVIKNDFGKYEEIKSKIPKIQKNKTDLHKKYKEGDIPEEEKKTYKKYIKELTEYKHLKHKCHLHYPYKLNELIMDIQVKLIGYCYMYERNKKFLEHFDKKNKTKVAEILLNIPEDKIIYKKINSVSKIEELKDIRDNICHFTHLSYKADKLNFLKVFDLVRQLVSHDRKLKNSLTKSIKNVFAKHNIDIEFKMESHKLRLKTIKSQTIYHLKGKKDKPKTDIPETLLHDDFIKMVRKIL